MKKTAAILWLFFSIISAQAQTDSLQQGDPNDPNCPCYNVQLRAEKEYKAWQMQQRKAKEDSLLKLHRKRKDHTRKRMNRNTKRKKKRDCPQVMILERELVI